MPGMEGHSGMSLLPFQTQPWLKLGIHFSSFYLEHCGFVKTHVRFEKLLFIYVFPPKHPFSWREMEFVWFWFIYT